jgi:CrcB protein
MTALLVALLGSLGAMARFLLDGWARPLARGDVPWATLLINVSGSLVLGVVTGLAAHGLPDTLRVAAGTGFCGGYTTFSAASFETVRLLERRELGAALVTCGGTLVLCLGAAAVGLLMTGG